MRRIKIPFLPVDEKKKVIEDVDKDRRYAIDASIVRIMKSRKVLGYQQLVMECAEQLRLMFKTQRLQISLNYEDCKRCNITRSAQSKISASIFRFHGANQFLVIKL